MLSSAGMVLLLEKREERFGICSPLHFLDSVEKREERFGKLSRMLSSAGRVLLLEKRDERF